MKFQHYEMQARCSRQFFPLVQVQLTRNPVPLFTAQGAQSIRQNLCRVPMPQSAHLYLPGQCQHKQYLPCSYYLLSLAILNHTVKYLTSSNISRAAWMFSGYRLYFTFCNLLFLFLFLSQQITAHAKTSTEATELNTAVKAMADFSVTTIGQMVKELDLTDNAAPGKVKMQNKTIKIINSSGYKTQSYCIKFKGNTN